VFTHVIDIQEAHRQITRNFPELRIDEITHLGEGFGNTAFEVNCQFVFRFAETPVHREELRRELPILELVARYSSLPAPRPEFMTADHSCEAVSGIIDWGMRHCRIPPMTWG
jgi:hypothetical protein